MLGCLVVLASFLPRDFITLLSPQPSLNTSDLQIGYRKEQLFSRIIELAPQTEWMVTDSPMFAFRARLKVPPFLAVFSGKRLATGELTPEEVLEQIALYKPEQVLFARFATAEFIQVVDAALAGDYLLDFEKEGEFYLYVRQDILASP